MPSTSRFQALYLSYLSQPASDRPIYRAIVQQEARTFLELGVGVGQRAVRMIELAGRLHAAREIQYAGIDPFEARTSVDGPGVTLKMAHRLLSATGARIQLVPGQPHTSLARVANALGQVDLVIISARVDPRELAGAWFYMPRLLHPESKVFQEKMLPGGRVSLNSIDPVEIESLATAASRRAA